MRLLPVINIHLREEKVRQLRQTLASYIGHFKHADAYRLTRSVFEKFTFLKDMFTLDNECQLVALYKPPFEPANLRGQYNWAIKQYQDFCIFFQVGKFCEFYGKQAEVYGKFFGLKISGHHNATQPCLKITPPPSAPPLKITRSRRLRQRGRGSYDSNYNPLTPFIKGELNLQPAIRNPQLAQCGFPVRYLKEFKEKALHAGLPYVVVGERGFYPSGLKKRVVTEIFRVTP